MTILSCAVFLLRDLSFALFLIVFIFLFEISVKSAATSCYLISCSISGKDFLFALSNFRNANFFNVCIQCVKMNLVNHIDKDLISSVNQIQSETDNQL